MQRLAHHALSHPRLWTSGGLLVTLLLALGMTRLELRTDGAALYPNDNQVIAFTRQVRTDFEEPERVLLLLSSREGRPTLASLAGFSYLEDIHNSVARMPGVAKEGVRSLVNLLDDLESPNLMCLPTFFDSIPTSEAGFALLLTRIAEFPLAAGLFLSQDGRTAAILVALDGDRDRRITVRELQAWADTRQHQDYRLALTGPVLAEASLGDMVISDLVWLVPLMVAAIALLLLIALRNLAGVVATMFEVVLVLVWTFGIMGYCGIPITLVVTILPVILMTLAVTDEIHFLERFLELLKQGEGHRPTAEMLRQAALGALSQVGRPVVLTSLTTAIGFFSFLAASIAPIRHFGLYTALGILLAMLFTFTLVPASLMLMPRAWFRPLFRRRQTNQQLPWLERSLLANDRRAFAIGLLVLVLTVPGSSRLTIQDAWMENFNPKSSLVVAEREYNRVFWGSYRFDVVFDAEADFFYSEPAVAYLRTFIEQAEQGPGVGGSLSFLDFFSRIAALQDRQDPTLAYSEEGLEKIAKVLPFFRQPMQLDRLLSKAGDRVMLQLFVNSPDYRLGRALEQHLEMTVSNIPQPKGLQQIRFSGDLAVADQVVGAIVGNQLRSVGWTLLGVTVLMLLVFRRFGLVVAAMVPVLASAAVILGGMGWFGVHLGIASSMFTALTVGVGIDFALHTVSGYKAQRVKLSHREAIVAVWRSTGRALRWNSLVMAAGFTMLANSALKPNRQLGLLLAAAMLVAYLATLIFLPVLLARVGVTRPEPRGLSEQNT